MVEKDYSNLLLSDKSLRLIPISEEFLLYALRIRPVREVFAEDNRLVIWSLDLFRQAKQAGESSVQALRKSIIETCGRWRGI